MAPPSPPTPEISDTPKGYVQGECPDGSSYILPQFLLPDLEFCFAAHRQKTTVGVVNYPPNLAQVGDIEKEEIAGGLLQFPPDPVPSPQERLSAHAEIIALQTQLGISYKDASHRLYMAEVEKLKVLDVQCKAWANLAASLKTSLGSTSTGDSQEENQENREKK